MPWTNKPLVFKAQGPKDGRLPAADNAVALCRRPRGGGGRTGSGPGGPGGGSGRAGQGVEQAGGGAGAPRGVLLNTLLAEWWVGVSTPPPPVFPIFPGAPIF